MMKRLPFIFCLLLSLCFSFPDQQSARALAQGATTASAQANSQTLNLAGLRERVTVRKDERGIPYIEAKNEADLYFAQGYMTASDRLWQMDILRRSMRGELAEIFGSAVLEEDKRHRIYGFAKIAEASTANLSGPVRAALEAYASGVNAFIESRDGKTLPPEFQILGYRPRAWTSADSIVIGKLFAEALSTTWPTDIMRAALSAVPPEKRNILLQETSPLDVILVGSDRPGKDKPERKTAGRSSQASAPLSEAEIKATLLETASIQETMKGSLERVGMYMEDRAVSNNWVVAGKRTATGKPLLANDPHLPASAPSIWYMTHLSAPGLRVAGITAPGAPGIILGHNERIAWGGTNLGPDVQDLYREKFDPGNPRRYLTPSGWRETEVRHEEIKVRKGFTDTATVIEPLDVTVTRHGPIILEKGGARYALRWTALDAQAVEFEAFYYINRARDWDGFRAALKKYFGPTQNFIYADTGGHIGYYGAGNIPIRKSGDGSVPYDGSTDAGDWTSFIPFDKLPHLYDPPKGFILTANQRIVGQDYPYFLTHEWTPPYRAHRIQDLLQAKGKLTVEDFRAIQGDTYSYAAENFVRAAALIARQTPPASVDEKWRDAVLALEKWDRHVDTDSHEALLAILMRDAFRRRVIQAGLGPDLSKEYGFNSFVGAFTDRALMERAPAWLPSEFKNYGELLRACYEDARALMTKNIGTDESQWTWGRFQKINFRHPLASVPFIGQQFLIAPLPQNGSISSINVGQNVSMRFIADTGDWDSTRQGITLGESGDPNSPHWKDQLPDWRAVTPRPFPFNDTAINANAKETILLMPPTKSKD
jgi:penicillin amidase